MNNNLTVFYRLCGLASTNPSPIFQEDKHKLNELCLKSFVRAFKGIDLKIVFIADFADELEMIKEICPFPFKYVPVEMGIMNTCLLQYELANKLPDNELILYNECDYFYLPNTGQTLLDGLDSLNLVVPYDNLNFYLDPSIHSEDVKLRLIKNHHWRTVERTTMTFAIKNEIFKANYDIFYRFGYLDSDVWHELRAKGHQMWSPVLSLATHMVKDFLAPGIEWNYEV